MWWLVMTGRGVGELDEYYISLSQRVYLYNASSTKFSELGSCCNYARSRIHVLGLVALIEQSVRRMCVSVFVRTITFSTK